MIALLALSAGPAAAQSVQLAPFGGQSYELPFFVAGAPGDPGRVFVVEGTGAIRLVRDGVTQATPFLDIGPDVLDLNEGGCECGLLSMALAPDYADSGLFYVFYTRDDPTPGNAHFLRIEEFRRSAANPDLADPATRRQVLEIPHFTAGNHNGGQLQFGPDGLLYISVGDGGSTPDEARNLSSRLGKLLRIDPRGAAPNQYAIPSDNPFADGAGPNADEIYSYGLRNPYRFSFDRSTGDLTIGDVGQSLWEEIDLRTEGSGRGANFGWNCFEGVAAYPGAPGACSPAPANHVPPVFQYAHSGSAAITGGYVIRDAALPSLAGRYIYADSSNGVPGNFLRTVTLATGGASGDAALGLAVSNPVSFGQDACGHLYVAAIGGSVQRLEPTAGPFPCKTAPELTVATPSGRRAARKRGIVLLVSCDEDCELRAGAVVKLARGRRMVAQSASLELELGESQRLKLALSRKQVRRLRATLARGRRAVVRFEVSASGGGGGTDTVSGRVRQRG